MTHLIASVLLNKKSSVTERNVSEFTRRASSCSSSVKGLGSRDDI